MSQTITVKIPRDGISTGKAKIAIESEGFRGETCKEATKLFEQCLGTTVFEDVSTAEMYETEGNVEWVQEGGGGND